MSQNIYARQLVIYIAFLMTLLGCSPTMEIRLSLLESKVNQLSREISTTRMISNCNPEVLEIARKFDHCLAKKCTARETAAILRTYDIIRASTFVRWVSSKFTLHEVVYLFDDGSISHYRKERLSQFAKLPTYDSNQYVFIAPVESDSERIQRQALERIDNAINGSEFLTKRINVKKVILEDRTAISEINEWDRPIEKEPKDLFHSVWILRLEICQS